MWAWVWLGSGALCPSAPGAVICILGSLMELVILQYFVITQTLSVLLPGAVPGYSRRHCKAWEWEKLSFMLKLVANLPLQTSINPERNLAEMLVIDFFLEMLVIDFFLRFLCSRGILLSSGSAVGHEGPEHRSEALPRLSVFTCQHQHVPSGSSSANDEHAGWHFSSECTTIFIRNGFALQD